MKPETRLKKELKIVQDEFDNLQAKILQGWKTYEGDNIFKCQGQNAKLIKQLKNEKS